MYEYDMRAEVKTLIRSPPQSPQSISCAIYTYWAAKGPCKQ